MACRNEIGVQVEKLLFWIIGLPIRAETLQSPTFWLMGSEWYLRFSYKKGNVFHVLSMHRVTDGPQQLVLKAKTYIMKPKLGYDDNDLLAWTVTVRNKDTDLWQSGNNSGHIYEHLPSLCERSELKFVCRFYGHPESDLQLQAGTADHLLPVANQKSKLTTEDKSVQVSSEVPRDIESLSSDFSRLLDKEILPDVKLKCRDRIFQAHRSVLAARSDVFRAMFQNETLESETGDVTIKDMEVGVLEKLLKFVYTGRPDDLSEDCTSDLYEAADKYAFLSLKAACSYWIERNLAVENCVTYLRVADSHCDRDLKAAVISFIIENPEVLKSESWLAISKELPALAVEVFQTYFASTVK